MTSTLLMIYAGGALATAAAAVGGFLYGLRRDVRFRRYLLLGIVGLSTYLLVAQILKLYANKNYADLATWLEIAFNLSRKHQLWTSLLDGMAPTGGHWFSAHFTPLFYIVAIPSFLKFVPEALLVTQFVLLSASVFLAYKYARHRFGDVSLALAAAAVFSLYPTYQYIQLYEFEMLRFSIPLLLAAFLALRTERMALYWVCLGAALLAREEVAVTTFLLGVHIFVFLPGRRLAGAATSLLSLVYFLGVTQVVIPVFQTGPAGEHVAAYWFEPLGRTIPEVLTGLVTKPGVVASLVLDPVKLANVFMYLLALMFLPLLGWPVLLISLGNVGMNLLSGSVTHTSYFLYYLSPSIPFFFIAFVDGAARLGNWLDERGWGGPGGRKGTPAVLQGALCAALAANLFFGPSPLSIQFWLKDYRLAPFRTHNYHYSQYLVTDHARRLRGVLAAVPGDAAVSAEQHILPWLHDRRKLRVFPDIEGVDYVVIDKKNPIKTGVATVPGSWHGLRENPQKYYDWLEKAPERWSLIAQDDGYFVFRRAGR